MHVHEVTFEVVDREGLVMDGRQPEVPLTTNGTVTKPEPWETGFKDTVMPPVRWVPIKATFATPGQFVWHCHIVEHEDNEMMRPYRIGPEQSGQPGSNK